MIEFAALQLHPQIRRELQNQAKLARQTRLRQLLSAPVTALSMRDALLMSPASQVGQALERFRRQRRTAALVVDVNHHLLGLLRAEDLVVKGIRDMSRPVAHLMSSPRVVRPQSSVGEALEAMIDHEYRELVLVDDDQCARSIIRPATLLEAVTAAMLDESEVLS